MRRFDVFIGVISELQLRALQVEWRMRAAVTRALRVCLIPCRGAVEEIVAAENKCS
jgi:hypothetical protein